MKILNTMIIVLFFGLAQFSFSQTTCFEADNNYVFEGGNSAKSIAKGDFNNDGDIDIIMGNALGAPNPLAKRVYYIQSNGGGTFLAPVEIESGSQVYDIAVGDFNNDGYLDIVAVNFNMAKTSIMFGNGDGTFQLPIAYSTSFGPTSVEVADVNNDGLLDFVITGNGNKIDVFLNDPLALGTMLPQPAINMPFGANPSGLTMAYFNGDNNIDIATSNSTGGSTSVFFGNGLGGFTLSSTIPTGSGASDIVSDDFNGDSKPDIAVVNKLENTVSILLNDGFGNFSSAVNYGVGEEPVSIETGDFDGDNIRDLAIVNTLDNSMSTLKGVGNGTFSPQVQVYAMNSPQDLIVGDFNGDGNDDVIHSCLVGEVMPVYWGEGDGTFILGNMVQVGNSPRDIATGDFTNSGNQDFAVVNYDDNTAAIYVNDGAGNYTFGQDLVTGNNPSSIVSGDFNGNNSQDIIVTNYTDGTASIFINNAGTFASPVTISVNALPIKIRKGDFNGDGELDLFIVNEGNQVTVLPGVGDGTFLAPIVIATGSQPKDIAVGRLDADLYDDFVVALYGANQVVAYKSDGSSGFSVLSTLNTTASAGIGPISVALADFTNDSRPEIVVAYYTSKNIKRFTNNGSGLFSPNTANSGTYASTDAGPLSITTGDFNGDGETDVAVTHLVSQGSTGNVVIFVGDGTGDLTFDIRHPVGVNPIAILADDFNNDGSLDLAIVNESSNYVSIMRSYSSTPVITADGPVAICGSGSVTLTASPAAEFVWSNGATSQSITVSLAGAYSVTTSAPGGGCAALSNVITVTNLTSPTLAFTGATEVCAGNSTTITISGADTYSWSDGLGTATTQNLTPGASKIYKVVGEMSNGCTDTLEIPIVVNPLPDAGFNNLDSQYCESAGNINLVANVPNGTFSGPHVAGTIFDPLAAGVGNYTITYTITDGNGCVNSTSQSFDVTAGGVDATFTSLATMQCEDDPIVSLVPVTPGGTFSGDGVIGTTFDPSNANIGVNTITYSISSGGCTGTSTQNVTVNEMPDAGFNGFNSEYCLNDASITLTPDQSGGTFSGSGISGSTFNPNTAGVGVHTIVYSITVGGCSSTESEMIEVKAAPDASFAGLGSGFCISDGSVTLSPIIGGGTFTGNGISSSNFDPAIAGLGTHTITYTVTANGCTATSTRTITVNPLPNATFSGLLTSYCVDAGSVTLSALSSGGDFTGNGISGTTFNPATAGAGTHTITYSLTDANGCSALTTQNVTVNPLPSLTITGLAANYCVDAGSVTLTGTPSGGGFSGNGVTGSTFDPATAGVGTHIITYTYTDGNGCTATTTESVDVNLVSDASFTGLNPKYCIDAATVTLTPLETGGTFSGNGISLNTFNPGLAGNGTHVITYTINNGNGCSAITTQTVIVDDTYPVATFTGLDLGYCVNASPIIMTPTVSGGLFSGNGIVGASFDPSVAGIGTHFITYTISGTNTCESSETVSVNVTAVPVATFNGLASTYCIDASAVTLTADQSGGSFSGGGMTGSSFSPATAGVGTHTITYSITDNGCTTNHTENVTVNPLPNATFSGLASNYCVDASVVTLIAGQSGGTYTGNGISGTTFNPATAGVGSHTITYSITDANGCSALTTQTLTVNPLPSATITGLGSDYCVDAGSVTLTGIPSGGTFSGDGISGSVFTPSIATVGTHIITYSVTDANSCSATSTESVIVNPLPDATFSGLGSDYCIDASAVTLSATLTGGTFSGNGVTGTNFNPATAGNGTHTITYSISDINGCLALTTQTVTVDDTYPVATFTGLASKYCVDATAVTMSPTVSGGIFTGTGVSGTTFDPSVAGVGLHTISYSITGTNTCSSVGTFNVEVTALPITTFTGLGASYCVDETSAVTLVATQTLGTFTGPGISGTTFTPSVAGTGTHSIVYSITDVNGCSSSTTESVDVNELPNASFTGLGFDYCANASSVTLLAAQIGGAFSGPGMIVDVFDPEAAGPGVHSIVYSITNGFGCSATSSQSVTVKPIPDATFSGLNSSYCLDASVVTLTATVSGGTFSGPGITGSTFNPNTAGIGTHTITYTPPALNGCSNSYSQPVTVTPLSNAAFSGLAIKYCIDAGIVTLTASQPGGTFSGSGISNNTFNPNTAGVGSHTITYTVTDGNGCTASSSQPTTVSNVYPDASLSNLASTYCVNAAAVTIIPNVLGGTFSGSVTSGNVFDPSVAGVGIHPVTYSITGTGGCTSTETVNVEVTALPVTTFTGLNASYCVDGAISTLIATNGTGTFSGPGISVNTFDPSVAGVGTHSIVYSITDANGCSGSTTESVVVNPLPDASFTGLSLTYCVDAATVSLTATETGGTFSGPGVSGPSFNPSVAGVGSHTITYSFTNTNGCSATSTQTVLINPLPDASFTGLSLAYCVDAGIATLTPAETGGNFTGPGITGSSFNPSVAGAGSHTITYTYSDLNGCSASTTENVVVNPLPSASFNGLASSYCLNSSVVTLTPIVPGGTFTGPGISGNTFNAATAGLGNHTINYAVTDGNGCFNTSSLSVQVNINIDASFTGPTGTYCSSDNTVITLVPLVSGGTFSGPGVTGSTWSPLNGNVGNNTIVYDISSGGCSNTSTLVINVLPSPNANFTPLDTVYCKNEPKVVLIPNQPGGTFTYTSGVSLNTFYPQIATLGSNTITYSITSTNGCSNSKSYNFEVLAGPVSTIIVNDTTLTAGLVGSLYTYQWMNCEDQTPIVEENSSVMNVGQNGTYSLVTSDGVCRDTSGCVLIYFADLETNLDEKGVKLYPNPNNGRFKIETSFDAKIEIINSIGQLVYRNEHIKGLSEIDLGSSIETGMYIVKFSNEKNISIYRNVVVRN